ncbi:MAG: AI-2E family transporter [Christensenellales bacterium]
MQLELLLPSSIRARVIEAGGAIQRELSGYVRGQLLISLIVGAITAAGLAILRIPAFLVLGLIMAVFNLIPYFGALLGAIPTVLLTLNMGWAKLLEVTIMLFLTQQAENMLIAPRLTGRTTGLHPVAVILALTAGGYLGGMVGMAFAIPGAIVIRGVFREAGRVREMKNEN